MRLVLFNRSSVEEIAPTNLELKFSSAFRFLNGTYLKDRINPILGDGTIAAFVSSMRDEILLLFRDVLLICDECHLLGGTLFVLDGSKVPSNASKEWSGKISELKRKKEKIEKQVKDLLRRQVEVDRRGGDGGEKEGGWAIIRSVQAD